MWHGYILYTRHHTLTQDEWDLCIQALEHILDHSPNALQPAHRLHWRKRLDGDSVIYEARFDESRINAGVIRNEIVQYVRDELGETIDQGTVNRNLLTVWELGKKWNDSRLKALEHIANNRVEWETEEI